MPMKPRSTPPGKSNDKNSDTKETDIFSEAFDPIAAGIAVARGIEYVKERLGWSGGHIAKMLHIPTNTFNSWLKKGSVPITKLPLTPDVQAITHLIAIHSNLESMFQEPIYQKKWLSTLHYELKLVPEELMAESIEGLIFIRQYLDYLARRGA